MSLESMATRLTRRGQGMLMVSASALQKWAQRRGRSLRQAFDAALAAGIFPECYERNFPSLNAREQLTLFRSSALVAGLGGLGGMLAVLLARVGVGRLLLADGDSFTPANLNRQLLATQRTLGLNKAEVTAGHLHDLNPVLVVEAIPHFLSQANLPTHLAQVQVALDGLDTVRARRELFGAAAGAGVPVVHGAVLGKFGQVAVIMPEDAAVAAQIFPPAAGDVETGREVLAATVSLVASLQVQEAVRLLLGQPPVYRGRLAHFDGDTGLVAIVPVG